MEVLFWILQVITVPLLSPLGIGVANKIKARMQHRRGASVFQPYRNLQKLFHKDEVISRDSSWIFYIAPYIVFGSTLILGSSIPLFTSALHSPVSDFLMVVYLLALGTFFLALAGMDTGGGFGGFGSSREMTLSALAEGALIFSMLTLVILRNTTNLVDISSGITLSYGHYFVPIVLAFSGFILVLLGEAKRYPFDNPDTHLELTMVHEAMLLEYSGKRLALMEWASANKTFIFAALAVNLYFPLGLSHGLQINEVAISFGSFILRLFVIYAGIAIVESVIAKFRYFRLPDLLFVAFIFNVVAIGLIR